LSITDTESAKAIQYSEKLVNAAIDVVGAARVELTPDLARAQRALA
jgi:hypothetical protein